MKSFDAKIESEELSNESRYLYKLPSKAKNNACLDGASCAE